MLLLFYFYFRVSRHVLHIRSKLQTRVHEKIASHLSFGHTEKNPSILRQTSNTLALAVCSFSPKRGSLVIGAKMASKHKTRTLSGSPPGLDFVSRDSNSLRFVI